MNVDGFNVSDRDLTKGQTLREHRPQKARKYMCFSPCVQKSNPRLEAILAEFDETISILTNKPE